MDVVSVVANIRVTYTGMNPTPSITEAPIAAGPVNGNRRRRIHRTRARWVISPVELRLLTT